MSKTKTKTCTHCLKEKALKEFNKDRRHKNGLCSWCRECRKEASKQRREKEFEKKFVVADKRIMCRKCGLVFHSAHRTRAIKHYRLNHQNDQT